MGLGWLNYISLISEAPAPGRHTVHAQAPRGVFFRSPAHQVFALQHLFSSSCCLSGTLRRCRTDVARRTGGGSTRVLWGSTGLPCYGAGALGAQPGVGPPQPPRSPARVAARWEMPTSAFPALRVRAPGKLNFTSPSNYSGFYHSQLKPEPINNPDLCLNSCISAYF